MGGEPEIHPAVSFIWDHWKNIETDSDRMLTFYDKAIIIEISSFF